MYGYSSSLCPPLPAFGMPPLKPVDTPPLKPVDPSEAETPVEVTKQVETLVCQNNVFIYLFIYYLFIYLLFIYLFPKTLILNYVHLDTPSDDYHK